MYGERARNTAPYLATSGSHGRAPGGTAGGATGVGANRLYVQLCSEGRIPSQRLKRRAGSIRPSCRGKPHPPLAVRVGGCFAFALNFHHHPKKELLAVGRSSAQKNQKKENTARIARHAKTSRSAHECGRRLPRSCRPRKIKHSSLLGSTFNTERTPQ